MKTNIPISKPNKENPHCIGVNFLILVIIVSGFFNLMPIDLIYKSTRN